MTQISLREYVQLINKLVEQGDYDQAIAHCKHILSIYPKHIDTYRLLGKSFLESKRYSDAEDIFQRIISSLPDDFIANVGISIVREDEGNLSESIWFMERAFESQPSNNAIQIELKKLIGRRDGVEPPKINLTRGALARMYIKGGLFQQAINELRSSLTDDPKRLDLQTLLAQAYFESGSSIEAVEICTSLLMKLPFSYTANMIMYHTFIKKQQIEEADAYLTRLTAIDPYFSFTNDTNPTPDLVPDEKVILEKLASPIESESVSEQPQPEWIQGLELELEKDQTLPDQLTESSIEESISAKEKDSSEEVLVEPTLTSEQILSESASKELTSEETEIPDWMHQAGWEESKSQGQFDTQGKIEFEEDLFTEKLEPAEIPDWLKSMSPDDGILKKESENIDEQSIDENIPWLEEAPPSESDSIANWLKELKDKDTPVQEETHLEQEGVPDWLLSLGEKAGTGEEYDLPSEFSVTEIEQPVFEEPQTEAPPLPEEELPDWLYDFEESDENKIEQPDTTIQDAIEASRQKLHLEVKDERKIMEHENPIEEEDTKPITVGKEDLAKSAGIESDQIEKTEIPDWLQDLAPELDQETLDEFTEIDETFDFSGSEERLEETIHEPDTSSQEIPDWLIEQEKPEIEGEEIKQVQPEQEFISQIEEIELKGELPQPDEWQQEFNEEIQVEQIAEHKETINNFQTSTFVEETTPVDELSTNVENEIVQPEELSKEASEYYPELDAIFTNTRQALDQGESYLITEQLEPYIKSEMYLEEILQEINTNLMQHPTDIYLWTCLGDVYMRVDQLQNALNAYIKVEELLN